MKLYVPRVSDQIKLLKDWRFKNQQEYRNESFIDAYWKYEEAQPLDDYDIFSDLAVGRSKLKAGEKTDIVVPRGTVLSFDRVYIRKGASSGWDSVTFRIKECPIKEFIKKRFWVKVDDANKIEYELVGTKNVLAPSIEIENLSDYDCRRGLTHYIYNIELDKYNQILTEQLNHEYHDVKINNVLEYKCIVTRAFDTKQCQIKLEEGYSENLSLFTCSIALNLLTLDNKELFRVGTYSTFRTKIKQQYIKDNLIKNEL